MAQKLTEITRAALRDIGTDFARELREVCDRWGIDVEPAGGRYGGTIGEVRLKISVRETASGQSAARAEFGLYCRRYGLSPEDHGRIFLCQGIAYRIAAIKPSRDRFPISAERIHDRRAFKFPADTVRRGLTLLHTPAA